MGMVGNKKLGPLKVSLNNTGPNCVHKENAASIKR